LLHEAFRLHEEKTLAREPTLHDFYIRQRSLIRSPWRGIGAETSQGIVMCQNTWHTAGKEDEDDDGRRRTLEDQVDLETKY
jgi:hypothetical protein